MKIDPYYQQRRCSPMTLVSGNVRFICRVPCKGASADDNGLIENVDIQCFWTLYIFGILEMFHLVSRRLFPDPRIRDLECSFYV